MKRRLTAVLLLALAGTSGGLLTTGVASRSEAQPPGMAPPGMAPHTGMPQMPRMPRVAPKPPENLTPEAKARRAKVLAKVGDTEINVARVEDELNALSPFLREQYRDKAKLQEFVEQMLRFELLAIEAEKRGYGENFTVSRTTKQQGVQHLVQKDFDEAITPATMPEAEVKKYFEENGQEFNRPEVVRASHIQVESKERADELIKELKEKDARAFRNAARENSVDRDTSLRGGDLRFFDPEGKAPNSPDPEVDQALVKAAFALKEVGDMTTEPVQVGKNWSVIKLTGRRPAQTRSYEEASQIIRTRMWRDRRISAMNEFVASLHKKYNPEIHADRLDPIKLDPTENPHAGADPSIPVKPGDEIPEPGANRPGRLPSVQTPGAAPPRSVGPASQH